MNLEKTMKIVAKTLKGKQDADKVTFTKAWDETGRLKGWSIVCEWDNGDSVWFDSTDYYCRIGGDLRKIPDFIKGKHQGAQEVRIGGVELYP